MRVIPNYRRYEPGFGFKPAPESGVACLICGYDIDSSHAARFSGGFCHKACLIQIKKIKKIKMERKGGGLFVQRQGRALGQRAGA